MRSACRRIDVSVVDLAFVAKRRTTVDEVNAAAKQAAVTDLKGILEYTKGELVSVDFNHNPSSSIFDGTLTKVSEGTLVKVCASYDNEWALQPDARHRRRVRESGRVRQGRRLGRVFERSRVESWQSAR